MARRGLYSVQSISLARPHSSALRELCFVHHAYLSSRRSWNLTSISPHAFKTVPLGSAVRLQTTQMLQITFMCMSRKLMKSFSSVLDLDTSIWLILGQLWTSSNSDTLAASAWCAFGSSPLRYCLSLRVLRFRGSWIMGKIVSRICAPIQPLKWGLKSKSRGCTLRMHRVLMQFFHAFVWSNRGKVTHWNSQPNKVISLSAAPKVFPIPHS